MDRRTRQVLETMDNTRLVKVARDNKLSEDWDVRGEDAMIVYERIYVMLQDIRLQ